MGTHPSEQGQDRSSIGESDRFSVVSSWFDAERMLDADLSQELVGRRVVADESAPGGAVDYANAGGQRMADENGTPGFLFSGDDGDSLWFWPETEDVAFRFEPESAQRLRLELVQDVSRLVSQGALVYCLKLDAAGDNGALIEFPGDSDIAA